MRFFAIIGAALASTVAFAHEIFADTGGIPLSMPSGMDLDSPEVRALGRRAGTSYGSTRGGRAHARWRHARASGRHDFRKTLSKRHG